MEFEFDERKSRSNKSKHGIDFVEAQELWLDDQRAEVQVRVTDEPRFLVIGKIGEACWSAVVTYRGRSTRLISVRRARAKEVELYESQSI